MYLVEQEKIFVKEIVVNKSIIILIIIKLTIMIIIIKEKICG
jgi:hypothetical protein